VFPESSKRQKGVDLLEHGERQVLLKELEKVKIDEARHGMNEAELANGANWWEIMAS